MSRWSSVISHWSLLKRGMISELMKPFFITLQLFFPKHGAPTSPLRIVSRGDVYHVDEACGTITSQTLERRGR